MNDKPKQIIPNENDVICLLDKTITESLDSHDTYKATSLFGQLWKLNYKENTTIGLLEEVLEKVYHNQSNISNSTLAKKIQEFIKNKGTNSNDREISTIKPFFTEGVNCNLLQPDGKGWQKGKLRICFEFTPENNENLVMAQDNSVKTPESSLDEIRQLTNSLPIDQN
jgi:KGK domain